jgi:hypothetical protein
LLGDSSVRFRLAYKIPLSLAEAVECEIF